MIPAAAACCRSRFELLPLAAATDVVYADAAADAEAVVADAEYATDAAADCDAAPVDADAAANPATDDNAVVPNAAVTNVAVPNAAVANAASTFPYLKQVP